MKKMGDFFLVFGIGALIFGIIIPEFISPVNTSADVPQNVGWQRAAQYIEVRNDWSEADEVKTARRDFSYNDSGYLIDWSSYSEDGKLVEKSQFRYDGHGYLLDWTSYDGQGNLRWKRTFEYDRNGFMKKWVKSAS